MTTTGESEQKIPLIPAHETDLIDQTQVIIKKAASGRSWLNGLTGGASQSLKSPRGGSAAHFAASCVRAALHKRPGVRPCACQLWQLSPELTRRSGPLYRSNGFAKKGRELCNERSLLAAIQQTES